MIPGWLDEIEEEVLACLCHREKISARELAGALGVSHAAAVHYLYLLASEGRLAIEVVGFAPGSEPGPPSETPLAPARRSQEEAHGVLVGSSLG